MKDYVKLIYIGICKNNIYPNSLMIYEGGGHVNPFCWDRSKHYGPMTKRESEMHYSLQELLKKVSSGERYFF